MSTADSTDILIVEDNPYDAELMVRALKKKAPEYHFCIVENGVDALDFVFCREKFSTRNVSKPVRAIFLDLKLPKVNGLEVLKEIKSTASTRSLPVIIITSSREDSDIRSAYELGANSYIVKSVDFDSFLSTIITTSLYWLSINQPPL
jgi:two-component system, response regulator